MIKLTLMSLAVLIILIFAYGIVRTLFLIQKTNVLMTASSPYQQNPEHSSMKILVLGDSTAVGTGATSNIDSTAGRLGKVYPQAEIINLSVNGQRIAGLLNTLNTMKDKGPFDLILIQIGANDIIRLTSMKDIDAGIGQVLMTTKALGKNVIILHSGDIGEATFFPWYVRPLLTKRSFEVREIYKKQTTIYGAHYVDLIDSSVAPLLKEDPGPYYSTDQLHLSGAGYGLWFSEISKYLAR